MFSYAPCLATYFIEDNPTTLDASRARTAVACLMRRNLSHDTGRLYANDSPRLQCSISYTRRRDRNTKRTALGVAEKYVVRIMEIPLQYVRIVSSHA